MTNVELFITTTAITFAIQWGINVIYYAAALLYLWINDQSDFKPTWTPFYIAHNLIARFIRPEGANLYSFKEYDCNGYYIVIAFSTIPISLFAATTVTFPYIGGSIITFFAVLWTLRTLRRAIKRKEETCKP